MVIPDRFFLGENNDLDISKVIWFAAEKNLPGGYEYGFYTHDSDMAVTGMQEISFEDQHSRTLKLIEELNSKTDEQLIQEVVEENNITIANIQSAIDKHERIIASCKKAIEQLNSMEFPSHLACFKHASIKDLKRTIRDNSDSVNFLKKDLVSFKRGNEEIKAPGAIGEFRKCVHENYLENIEMDKEFDAKMMKSYEKAKKVFNELKAIVPLPDASVDGNLNER